MAEILHLRVLGCDQADTEDITRLLRQEILELDVENVDASRSASQVPDHAKGLAFDVGELIVTLANTTIIPALIHLIGEWTARRPRHAKIIITYAGNRLEIEDVDASSQQAAVDAFLDSLRHGGPGQ